jgi:hypothetical protein
MSDLLQSTAVSFLACLDRVLIPDFPFSLIVADPDCLVAAEQASFLSMQRSNPAIDPTLAQLLLYDVADCWLRWLADPVNSETQEQLMVARAEIDAACGITEEDDDD